MKDEHPPSHAHYLRRPNEKATPTNTLLTVNPLDTVLEALPVSLSVLALLLGACNAIFNVNS